MNTVVKVAVVTETHPGERRVALVPDGVRSLVSAGWTVSVQSGAGMGSSFPDADYTAAGAQIVGDIRACLAEASLLATVHPPSLDLASALAPGTATLGFFDPGGQVDALRILSKREVTVFSFDLLPRISRAQSMDALSSQATVAGYRAALTAANHLGRFFPMLMTAAGTVPPAKVLVMGAGVAGLQAIATARRLGAVVRAYDVRAAAKEETESLGAKFVDLGISAEGAGGYARELSPEQLASSQRALAGEVARSDVVITTASVPGRRAPILLTTAMVEAMAPGSIVVDIAADSGGNCEATKAGEEVVVGATTVVGMTNPASTMPTHASLLYSRNVVSLIKLIQVAARPGSAEPGTTGQGGTGQGGTGQEGTDHGGTSKLGELDFSDEIVAGVCVLAQGRPVNPRAAEILGMETVVTTSGEDRQ